MQLRNRWTARRFDAPVARRQDHNSGLSGYLLATIRCRESFEKRSDLSRESERLAGKGRVSGPPLDASGWCRPRALLVVRLAECAADVVVVERNPHDDAVRDCDVFDGVQLSPRLEDAVGAVVVREVSVGFGVDLRPADGVEGRMVG